MDFLDLRAEEELGERAFFFFAAIFGPSRVRNLRLSSLRSLSRLGNTSSLSSLSSLDNLTTMNSFANATSMSTPSSLGGLSSLGDLGLPDAFPEECRYLLLSICAQGSR